MNIPILMQMRTDLLPNIMANDSIIRKSDDEYFMLLIGLLEIFSILVALTVSTAMPTDTKSVAIEDSGEKLSPAGAKPNKRRSLGQFLGSILERTPLRNLLPSRCSHHDHNHEHNDYDYDDHHDDHHHHHHDHHNHHFGHGHGHLDHRTEPTSSSSTPLQPTTYSDRSVTPTNRNVEDTLTTSSTTTTSTTPATITSSLTPRYNDPDNELTEDIDLRFGKAR